VIEEQKVTNFYDEITEIDTNLKGHRVVFLWPSLLGFVGQEEKVKN